MGDFIYLTMFIACCLLTAGLAAMCDKLMPHAGQEGPKP